MINFVIFLGLGKALIKVIQKFSPLEKIKTKYKYLGELLSCDLCLGCWIYFALALAFNVWIFEPIEFIPVLSPFLMGIFSSYLMYYLSVGFMAVHGTVIIE